MVETTSGRHAEEGADLVEHGRGVVDQLAIAQHEHLFLRENPVQVLQLPAVQSGLQVTPERCVARLDPGRLQRTCREEIAFRFQPVAPQMTPIGIGTVDRVPDHRDHLHVRNQCSNPLVRCGVPQIERRALAAQCPGRRIGEQALVGRTLPHPFLGTVRITRTLLLRRVGSGLFTHEELRFFGIGQEKIRMLRQCDMQSCRAGLRRADDQEIGERHRESLTVRMAGMRGGIFVSSPSGTPISDCCKETSRGGALDPAGDRARSR